MNKQKKILLFDPVKGIPELFKDLKIDTFEDRVLLYKILKRTGNSISYRQLLFDCNGDMLLFFQNHPKMFVSVAADSFYGWDSEKEKIVPLLGARMVDLEYEEYAEKSHYGTYIPQTKIEKTLNYMEEK